MTGTAKMILGAAFGLAAALTMGTTPRMYARDAEPRDIGSRLELFVDDWLIDSLDGAELEVQNPTPKEVVFEYGQRPWERANSLIVSVFKDGETFRMYYRTADESTSYAESDDGIHWTRPNLGLIAYEGSKDTNIVVSESSVEWLVPFVDRNPAAIADQRYKAVARYMGTKDGRKVRGLWAYASPDGIHWEKMNDEPVLWRYRPKTSSIFDSVNLAFYYPEQGRYVCYWREERDGRRDIRFTHSDDFIHWAESQWLDYGDAPKAHLYTNNVTFYERAPHILLADPKRFENDRHQPPDYQERGIGDTVFMSSRDGAHWMRFRDAMIRPGPEKDNWTWLSPLAAWQFIPVGDEIWLYVGEHYLKPTNRVRRYVLRLDGFVSVSADAEGGEMVTKPLTFEGEELIINYATAAAGSVQVEIQDERGEPIEGFRLEQCPVIYGDQIERVVSWEGGSDVSSLAGQPVRLRFVIEDGDLYSIRFRPREAE